MKAGFYETNITPPLDCFLPGYYEPNNYALGVDEELFSRAVVIEGDNNDTVAFVSIESLTIPEDLHGIVTKRIFEHTGIKSDNVCLTSVHTHKGGPITAPSDANHIDTDYKDVCFRKIADAVILASQRLQPVTVSFDTVQVPGIAHNRTSIMPNGTYRTFICDDSVEASKLAGEDDTLTVMSFKATDGTPIGSISNFALHSDTTGHFRYYSGDYSSILGSTLKEKYGNNFVNVFLLGTCGDINHVNHNVASRPDYFHYHRVIGKKLGENAINLIENATPITKTDVHSVKELVTFKKRTPSYEEALEELALVDERGDEYFRPFFQKDCPRYLALNRTSETDLYLQCITVGDVCIHILPGECFVEIGLDIKKASPFGKCFVAENSNSYCGYIPTSRAFDKEKSRLYETALAFHTCLSSETADIIIKKSVELANKLL